MPELVDAKCPPPSPKAAFPFDRMIPITMSHYPITYSGVINDPSPGELAHYMSRLSRAPEVRRPSMIYLHIPFCDQICTFCRYARGRTPEREVIVKYVGALKEEMRRHLEYPGIREMAFDLIYFGGGTPSVVPVDLMADLLSWIVDNFTNGKREISFEGEARTIKSVEYLSMLRERGVSRISMGVQTFDPRLRKLLGRQESLEHIEEAIANAKSLSMEVNFDLLYWLPYQTIAHLEADIGHIQRLGPTDVDWYNMVYDPLLKNDPLSRLISKKRDTVADTQGLIEMRKAMRDGCGAAGYAQRFVDNYSSASSPDAYHVIRTGCYDGSGQTLGVGVSSLGTLGNFVYSNPGSVESYYEALEREQPIFKWVFDLTPARRLERTLFHFARNMRFPKRVFDEVGEDAAAPYLERTRQLVARGLIDETEDEYQLSEEGKLWYGNVATHLLGDHSHERTLKRLYMKVLD